MPQLRGKQAFHRQSLLPRHVRLDLALGFFLAQDVCFFHQDEVVEAEPLQEAFL